MYVITTSGWVLRGDRFDISIAVGDDAADPAHGSGLAGLKDRVETVGGTLTVRSRPGEGTRLIACPECVATG